MPSPPASRLLAEEIKLLRRYEDPWHASVSWNAMSTHQPLPSSASITAAPSYLSSSDEEEESSGDDFYSDSDDETGTPTYPSWAATTTHPNGTISALKHEEHWQHPSLRRQLPKEAIMAMAALGVVILLLMVSAWVWRRSKKRAQDDMNTGMQGEEGKLWIDATGGGRGHDGWERLQGQPNPPPPVYMQDQYDAEDGSRGSQGWTERVRRSVRKSVRQSVQIVGGHHCWERENDIVPKVKFAEDVHGRDRGRGF